MQKQEVHINDKVLAKELVLLYSLIGKPVFFKERENSQVIRLMHKKGNLNKSELGVNCLDELVLGLNKSGMVGLASIQKYSTQTKLFKKIRQGAFYPVRVCEIIESNNTEDFLMLNWKETTGLFIHLDQ